MELFYLAGFVISLYLSILLITKKQKSAADKILAAWLFVAGGHLAFIYWYFIKAYKSMPAFIGWELPLPLVHGPFLYTYILFLTRQRRTRYGWLLHFIPFFLAYAYMSPFLSLPGVERLAALSANWQAGPWGSMLKSVVTAIIGSGVIYVGLSLWLLRKHRKNIGEQLSNTEKATLNWLLYLIAGMGVIWLFVMIGRQEILYLSVVIFIIVLGYFGIRQAEIFTNPTNMVQPAIVLPDGDWDATASTETTVKKAKYEKSGLTELQAAGIQERLTAVMGAGSWYKKPDLTLSELAGVLGVAPGTLSQVINTREQKSFYDYINGLRVKEFITLLNQPASGRFTLLALALECGFNSKSSFNRNFKKITGLSPREYVKVHHIKIEEE